MQADRPKVSDEYTHDGIDPKLAAQAKKEEREFLRKTLVWKVVPRSRAEVKRVVGTQLVSCEKGDATIPDIRCRLGYQEVNTHQPGFFAATPPLEALLLILNLAAGDSELAWTSRGRTLTPRFPAMIMSNVHVKPDLDEYTWICGTSACSQDAAQGWAGAYQQAHDNIGAKRGNHVHASFATPSSKCHSSFAEMTSFRSAARARWANSRRTFSRYSKARSRAGCARQGMSSGSSTASSAGPRRATSGMQTNAAHQQRRGWAATRASSRSPSGNSRRRSLIRRSASLATPRLTSAAPATLERTLSQATAPT